LSRQFAARANLRFEFQKRSQLFIRTHNEAFSVAAMRVCNPDRKLIDGLETRCNQFRRVGDDMRLTAAEYMVGLLRGTNQEV